MSKIGLLAVATVLATGSVAYGEDCLPALDNDTFDLTQNTQQNLVLLERFATTANEDQKKGFKAIFGEQSLGFNASKQLSSTLNRLLNINYSYEQRTSVLISTLGPARLEAYKTCMMSKNKDDISYAFSGDILGTKTFFLQVNWHPQKRPEPAKTVATLGITQGKFIANGKNEIALPIEDRKSEYVMVERDPFDDSQIVIKIDGAVAFVHLPRTSRMRIVTDYAESKLYKPGAREARGDIGPDVCIEIEKKDQIILPDTFRYVFLRQQTVKPATITGQPPHVRNDYKVCGHVAVQFGSAAPLGEAYAEVYAVATTLKAVPVQH